MCANFSYFRNRLWSDVTGSDSSSILRYLKNLHAGFHHGTSNLHLHSNKLFKSNYPLLQHLLFWILDMAILTGVRWNLDVIFIYF